MATAPITAGERASAKPAAGIRGLWWKALTGLWMAATILATFLWVGPSWNFPNPDGARAIIFHVPCAELITLFYAIGAWYAGRCIVRIRRGGLAAAAQDDYKSAAAMELGLLFAILTTATGSLFSRMEWGAYWSWDPRQTSIVVICLIFAAYVVLRGAVEDAELRARLAAVYGLVAIVPGLFLIWVLPRVVETLHSGANSAVIGNQLGTHYRLVMYPLALPSFLLLFLWLMQLRVRLFELEARRSLKGR